MVPVQGLRHPFDDTDRASGEFEAPQIERPREQDAVLHVDQVTGWQIPATVGAFHEDLADAGLQCLDDDLTVPPPGGAGDPRRGGREQDGFAAGQQVRIAEQLVVFGGHQRFRLSAVRRDAQDALADRGENDPPIAPARAGQDPRRANRRGGAAGYGDPLESLGRRLVEGEPSAVRGKHRVAGEGGRIGAGMGPIRSASRRRYSRRLAT